MPFPAEGEVLGLFLSESELEAVCILDGPDLVDQPFLLSKYCTVVPQEAYKRTQDEDEDDVVQLQSHIDE